MPRTARVIVPNCPRHIAQRGNSRRAVFIEEADYHYYLETLRRWKQELDIKVYVFCLMTNHTHLMVKPGSRPETISLLMKRLAGRQTRYVNKQEGQSGTLGKPVNDYRDFVQRDIEQKEQAYLSEVVARNQVAGSARFAEEVAERAVLRITNRRPGRPRK